MSPTESPNPGTARNKTIHRSILLDDRYYSNIHRLRKTYGTKVHNCVCLT